MRTPLDELIEDLERGRAPARAAWHAFAVIVMLILAMALVLHFIARAAYAQPTRYVQLAPRVIFDCAQFAGYARNIAVMREIGADRDKFINELRRDLRAGLMLAVLEREVKRIYAGKPTRIEAESDAYRRCQAQLGDMGAEG